MKIELLPFKVHEIEDGFVLSSPNSPNYFCCDSELFQRIVSGDLDEDIALKLYQLGLCKIDGKQVLGFINIPEAILPRFFLIDLTTQCNLRCLYCFRDLSNEMISSKVLEQILSYITRYCRDNKVKEITVQPWGGEPLLALERIQQIYEHFQDTEIKADITFQTNGTRITREVAEILAKMNCNLGISLDGLETLQNKTRPLAGGQGSYTSVLRGITNIRDAGHEINGTILVLTKVNEAYLEEIMDFYAKKLKFTSMKINYVIDNDNLVEKNICLTPQEYAAAQLRALDKMIELHDEGYSLVEESIMLKGRNLLFGTTSDICRSAGCKGGYRMIAFDPSGNIYPCDMTDKEDMIIGSIYSDLSLVEVIRDASTQHAFFDKGLDRQCLSCSWKSYCMGGCKSSKYYSHSSFAGRDEFECESNQILYPYLISMFSQNPGLVTLFN